MLLQAIRERPALTSNIYHLIFLGGNYTYLPCVPSATPRGVNLYTMHTAALAALLGQFASYRYRSRLWGAVGR